MFIVRIFAFICAVLCIRPVYAQDAGTLAYIVSDVKIPFWQTMAKGIESRAIAQGYQIDILSADNNAKTEIQNVLAAIKSGVDGLVISPTSSSAAVTLLKLADKKDIPVVIADIGADESGYVSFISSDNTNSSYKLGKLLAKKFAENGWVDGTVGVVAIPQKRANGQARTAGFKKALRESKIGISGFTQQVDFSHQETYNQVKTFLEQDRSIRAVWLQGSSRYKAALEAIADAGRKGEVLLLTFDAEPEYIDLIPGDVLVGAAMQQPFLMGEKAVDAMAAHLSNQPDIPKEQKLDVLVVSKDNIESLLPVIQRNVLGLAIQ